MTDTEPDAPDLIETARAAYVGGVLEGMSVCAGAAEEMAEMTRRRLLTGEPVREGHELLDSLAAQFREYVNDSLAEVPDAG